MNSPIPRRVQRELEQAEALETQIAQARMEPASNLAPTVDALLESEAPVETTSEPPNTPVATPAAPPEPPKDNFEHKYRVLQGMYEADVKRLRDQIRDLGTAVQSLQAAPPPPAPAAQLDPKDIETFGKDLVEMVKRYAEGQQVKVNERLTALENHLGMVVQQTHVNREQVFFDKLTQLVPDWQQINQDERWLLWLGEVDPVYGMERQQAIKRAQGALDATRVANIFRTFKNTLPPPPAPPEGLEREVTPSGAGNPPPPPPAPSIFITEAAINAFYRDVAQGKYVGRDDEFQRKEAAINKAVAENRVRATA